MVRELGVDGDHVCDRKHHGGEDQAVYAYAEHEARRWSAELGRALPPGWFGENLRVSGIETTDAVIGERWSVGTGGLVLEATIPRVPCVTFERWSEQEHWTRRFARQGDVGVYTAGRARRRRRSRRSDRCAQPAGTRRDGSGAFRRLSGAAKTAAIARRPVPSRESRTTRARGARPDLARLTRSALKLRRPGESFWPSVQTLAGALDSDGLNESPSARRAFPARRTPLGGPCPPGRDAPCPRATTRLGPEELSRKACPRDRRSAPAARS